MANGKEALNAHSHVRSLEKQKEAEQRKMKEAILQEELVAVSISPIYKKRIGKTLPVSVGTETISIPVDGQTYKIRKAFAEVLRNHIAQIDKEETRADGQWRNNRGNVYPVGEIPGT